MMLSLAVATLTRSHVIAIVLIDATEDNSCSSTMESGDVV